MLIRRESVLFKDTFISQDSGELNEHYTCRTIPSVKDTIKPFVLIAEKTLKNAGLEFGDDAVFDPNRDPAVYEAHLLLCFSGVIEDCIEELDSWKKINTKRKRVRQKDEASQDPLEMIVFLSVGIGELGAKIQARPFDKRAAGGISCSEGGKRGSETRYGTPKQRRKYQAGLQVEVDKQSRLNPGKSHNAIAKDVAIGRNISSRTVLRYTKLRPL